MSTKSARFSALRSLGVWAADAPQLEGEPSGRIPPRSELVIVSEVEAVAKRKLASTVYSAIAGGDRAAFERILLRPRRFVNVERLDLTAELFGEKMFTPILIGPAGQQSAYDPDGEIAMVRGAAKAQTAVVISSRSSKPIDRIAAEAKTPLWYQVYPEPDMAPVLAGIRQAVAAGCKVVCLTAGAGAGWGMVDRIRQTAGVPVVLKGVMTAAEARLAVEKGVSGIVVSNHGGVEPGMAAPIEVLPSIVDAVAGQIPVLMDGGLRRGTDIVKALAFGARAVMVTRPALWGLAAYGADGVDTVMKMLQSETARTMGNCCKVNLAMLDRTLVRVVRR